MGGSGSGKSYIESKLETMGFTRSISYTSREPKVRNGKLEENGKEYRFVTREKFLELVDKGIIIEHEEYDGNLYGTPVLIGSSRYVAVVFINGFKALKEKYGNQVVGVYLKCDRDIAIERAKSRDCNIEQFIRRYDREKETLDKIEEIADITIDSSKDECDIIAAILKAAKE